MSILTAGTMMSFTAVKTSAMDLQASATRNALDIVQAKTGDFFRSQLPESDYQQWKRSGISQ